jgi:membrane protease YdiL (CAAX protease family)
MSSNEFELARHPWLFSAVFILVYIVCNLLVSILLIGVFKLPRDVPTTGLWANALVYALMLAFIVPNVLGFLSRSHPYASYLSEIRLTQWQPVLKLLLLGTSCYLILALCQVAGTIVYRLMQGQPVDLGFLRGAFILRSELPPRSSSWLVSFTGVFEELAYRGVILALFLRFYDSPRAVLFSALAFGAMHILNLVSGGQPVWVAGQVVWATMLGVFYGYVTLKTGSLLPAILIHYLGNLFVSALNAYVQQSAPLGTQALYGIVFTMGVVPTVLMSLWVRALTSWWPKT